MPCQLFERRKNRCMRGEIARTDTREQRIDKISRSGNDRGPLASFDGGSGRPKSVSGHEHALAPAPLDE